MQLTIPGEDPGQHLRQGTIEAQAGTLYTTEKAEEEDWAAWCGAC